MCGICGLFNTNREPVDPALVKRMTDVLLRRGPDGEGDFFQGPVGLGHRRLSIIDVEGGAQPLFNEDKTLVIVFNGEIYNYIELRDELIGAGHCFTTRSDTEVIVHAYEQWGLDCVHRFNGMWAFALWDAGKRGLFLSRDRIGEKPLFYYHEKGRFYFASEIKSLLAGGIETGPVAELVSLYLALGYIPAPLSFYRGVRKLEPGHSLWIDESGLQDRRYWTLPFIPEAEMERDGKKARRIFSELFEDAVCLRMRSDVPYGAFLSGGLDSSAVVSVMARISPRPVSTFTIGFPEKDFDERPLARLVARQYRTLHHEEEMRGVGLEDRLQAVLDCYDEPFGDSSAVPTGAVAAHAARYVKMVLSGDGGDEVLSGYNSYLSEKGIRYYRLLPACLRGVASGLTDVLGPLFRGRTVYEWNRISRLLRTANLSFQDRLREKTFRIEPSLLKRLTDGCGVQVDPSEFLNDRLRRDPYRNPFYRLMYFHFTTSLPDDMLAKVDRMSMYHSLEVRLPFLDHRLVEFTAGLHQDVKLRLFRRKSLLLQTVGKRLPRAVRRAPKRGFVIPFREWFKETAYRDQLTGLLSLTGEGFNQPVLADLVEAHVSGKQDYGQLLWMLLLLRRWFSTNPKKNRDI